jgi:Ca2+-binding RTX toxin-like protein
VSGGDGDDQLFGGRGDDGMWMDPGDDELAGGTGSDTYFIVGAYPFGSDRIIEAPDADDDTLDFREGAGSVTLDLGVKGPQQVLAHHWLAFAHGREIENVLLPLNDFFVNWHHRVTGNARDNRIVGGPNADTLDGAGGDDTLVGAGGPDLLVGGDGEDAFDARDAQTDELRGGDDEDSILSKDDDDVLLDIP